MTGVNECIDCGNIWGQIKVPKVDTAGCPVCDSPVIIFINRVEVFGPGTRKE